MQIYFTIFLVITLFFNLFCQTSINLVVFSCDRPLQLQAFLHSWYHNVSGCQKIAIVYRCTSDIFEMGYNKVKSQFPQIIYLQQNTYEDFKPLTQKAIDFDHEKYVMFAVDDIIVTRPINCNEIIANLETYHAQGFYLRLGKNITQCYTESRKTGKPPLAKICSKIYRWKFHLGTGDWNYPYTLDMTVYSKNIIKRLFEFDFDSPNTMESAWAEAAPTKYFGLCYKYSCIVNCPLNIVQTDYPGNRHNNFYTPENLLKLFLGGYELNINPLQNIKNKSPHIEYQPTFIKSNR